MIKLFLWNPRLPKKVGHISMELSDGTYISFWPEEKIRLKSKCSRRPQSYIDDVVLEGCVADKYLELPSDMLNQPKIKYWWSECLIHEKYHLVFNNCAVVVKRALEEGGINEVSKMVTKSKVPLERMNYPKVVFLWVSSCKKVYVVQRSKNMNGKCFRFMEKIF